ncbi:LOW QUALITY PROTEIN: uncharacterized protein LOC134830061 [Culicoides brevitarsis]|uniref:LOW QUALITY PROTEIN: uncharacterized protein LOC134830061 n=1 Tax=Culicoides brevitarsis TaxID=469753 RepID=UPI00307B39AF
MFSSCCRCVNKKAVLKDEQLSENESDDSKSEKVPEDSNLIRKIPLRDPNAATNGVKVTEESAAVNVIDTVIKEEAEEDITSPPSSDPASLIDKNDIIVEEDEKNGVNGDASVRSDSKANTLNAVSNASSNISDEEKQKILELQQQASTDNEDDALDSIAKDPDNIVDNKSTTSSSNNSNNEHVKTDVVTSDENLSTSNENTDDTVKEISCAENVAATTTVVATIETKPSKSNDTSDNSIEHSSSLEVNQLPSIDASHHDEDQSFDESSIQSSNFPTPPPPICHVPPNSFEASSFEIPPDLIDCDEDDDGPREYIVTFEEGFDAALQRKGSILSRGGSRSSIKKKVNYNTSDEVIPATPEIPPPPPEEEDNDEVFSDSVPPMLPRGDMCTPFLTKRGSIPGLAALPDWFREEKLLSDRELGGILEPPTTPIGRDEVALKRHRFFSDLISAAQAAAEHRVSFDPLGPFVADVPPKPEENGNEDCDPATKQTSSNELESLIGRLERLVDRLERTVSARELEYTTQLLQTVQTVAAVTRAKDNHHGHILQRGGTIEEDTLKSLSNNNSISGDVIEQRVASLEESASQINCTDDDLLCQIPTVVEEALNYKKSDNMSVMAYQDIMMGPLAQYLALSAKIGGDVATQADFVKKAFDAQLAFVTLATESAKPSDADLPRLLQPTSEQINNIQTYREKHRTSPFFNHLSAISESIPALGWVCVSPTPGPHVKEMNDAGQFYTNRVLKDWKEKDQTHVEWVRAWIQTLTELQAFIKQYHTTGLVWSGKGKASVPAGVPPPPPGGMPPPPPPISAMGDLSVSNGGDNDRSALFAAINCGEAITSNLKKVTSDMQTHKNPNLRSGPAPYKAPQPFKPTGPKPFVAPQQDDKPPVFNRDGKKWLIEYHKNNPNLLVENAEMNNVVYMFKCTNSTLQIKGKINSVVMDSCKKCSVVFDSLVSSVEFVNCQSVQMQVLGKVPTISIDKTDGCQMYLSKDSLDVEVISSKSSEMNVMIPQPNGDYTEQPIPEQFKTTVKGTSLNTTFVESLG